MTSSNEDPTVEATKKNESEDGTTPMYFDKGLSDNQVQAEFDRLCRGLNMDKVTSEAAWNSYSSVRQYYALDVRSIA